MQEYISSFTETSVLVIPFDKNSLLQAKALIELIIAYKARQMIIPIRIVSSKNKEDFGYAEIRMQLKYDHSTFLKLLNRAELREFLEKQKMTLQDDLVDAIYFFLKHRIFDFHPESLLKIQKQELQRIYCAIPNLDNLERRQVFQEFSEAKSSLNWNRLIYIARNELDGKNDSYYCFQLFEILKSYFSDDIDDSICGLIIASMIKNNQDQQLICISLEAFLEIVRSAQRANQFCKLGGIPIMIQLLENFQAQSLIVMLVFNVLNTLFKVVDSCYQDDFLRDNGVNTLKSSFEAHKKNLDIGSVFVRILDNLMISRDLIQYELISIGVFDLILELSAAQVENQTSNQKSDEAKSTLTCVSKLFRTTSFYSSSFKYLVEILCYELLNNNNTSHRDCYFMVCDMIINLLERGDQHIFDVLYASCTKVHLDHELFLEFFETNHSTLTGPLLHITPLFLKDNKNAVDFLWKAKFFERLSRLMRDDDKYCNDLVFLEGGFTCLACCGSIYALNLSRDRVSWELTIRNLNEHYQNASVIERVLLFLNILLKAYEAQSVFIYGSNFSYRLLKLFTSQIENETIMELSIECLKIWLQKHGTEGINTDYKILVDVACKYSNNEKIIKQFLSIVPTLCKSAQLRECLVKEKDIAQVISKCTCSEQDLKVTAIESLRIRPSIRDRSARNQG